MDETEEIVLPSQINSSSKSTQLGLLKDEDEEYCFEKNLNLNDADKRKGNFSRCNLQFIPDQLIISISLITILNFSNNCIKRLPLRFGFTLPNLCELNLADNQIMRIQKSFSNLNNLKWLNFDGNPLVESLQKIIRNSRMRNPHEDSYKMCAISVVEYAKQMTIFMSLNKNSQKRKIKNELKPKNEYSGTLSLGSSYSKSKGEIIKKLGRLVAFKRINVNWNKIKGIKYILRGILISFLMMIFFILFSGMLFNMKDLSWFYEHFEYFLPEYILNFIVTSQLSVAEYFGFPPLTSGPYFDSQKKIKRNIIKFFAQISGELDWDNIGFGIYWRKRNIFK